MNNIGVATMPLTILELLMQDMYILYICVVHNRVVQQSARLASGRIECMAIHAGVIFASHSLEAHESTSRRARLLPFRWRVESYIAHNMADPDLSVARIAAALNCTKRYLHKVFNVDGQTLASYLWSLRLERCREDLEDSGRRRRPITDIAFSWGFSSSSHFSRVFKARFGSSPRQYRQSRLPPYAERV
jgi:AraC-like DNA-binding protein